MLKDMEHSKKTLEEELQKTSEVRDEPGRCVEVEGLFVRCQWDVFTIVESSAHSIWIMLHPTCSDTGMHLPQNTMLSSPESMSDRWGEHPSEKSAAGGRGWGRAAAGQQCGAGLRGGDPAAGGRDQRPEEPAGQQEASTRSRGHQGETRASSELFQGFFFPSFYIFLPLLLYISDFFCFYFCFFILLHLFECFS